MTPILEKFNIYLEREKEREREPTEVVVINKKVIKSDQKKMLKEDRVISLLSKN